MSNISQTKEGIWVINGDTHFKVWIEECGRLDHDQWTLNKLLLFIQENDNVIDIGAYIGDHTIAYLNKVSPNGKVYAFEPNPTAFECLQKNCPQAISYNVGLGDIIEDQFYWIQDINGNYGASFLQKEKPKETVNYHIVNMTTLENAMQNCPVINFIKMDCEGFEYKILKGSKDFFQKNMPIICFEVNDCIIRAGSCREHLFELIHSLNYNWIRLDEIKNITDPQFDVIAIPKKYCSSNFEMSNLEEIAKNFWILKSQEC